MLKQQLQDHIIKAKTEKAINELLIYGSQLTPELYNELILISARFQQLTQTINKGIRNADQSSESIQITESLLQLIGRLPDDLMQERSNAMLPALGHFFGRKKEREQILDQLRNHSSVAIAITGGAGIGKSSLCRSILHDPVMEQMYRAARYFINCEGTPNTELVLTEIAAQLQIKSGPQLETQVINTLSKQPILLAIDNAETPLGSDRINFESLLNKIDGLANVALLCTIRGVDVPIGPAWVPEIRLKVLDFATAKSTFLATAGIRFENDTQLTELLSLLGGYPLAIVLMASQARLEPNLSALLKNWKQKKSQLFSRGAGEHRLDNLGASLELSLKGPRITEAGLSLFSVLSQLPEGVDYADLESLMGEIGQTGARELIINGLAFYLGSRLLMLPPISQYGQDNYGPDQESLEKLIVHYCEIAKRGEEMGTASGAEIDQRISQDLNNFYTMANLALERLPENGIQAALGLAEHKLFTGKGAIWLLENARKKTQKLEDVRREANCIRSLGDIAFRESENAQARGLFEQAMPLYDQVGSLLGKANCLDSLGDIAFMESDNAQARALFEEAMPLYDQVGSLLGKANCILSLGDIDLDEKRESAAQEKWLNVLTLYQKIKDRYSIAWTWQRLAGVGTEEEKVKARQAAIEIGKELGLTDLLEELGEEE